MFISSEEKDGFEIRLYFLEEPDEIYWDFENEQEQQELYDKIRNGELLHFCAKVTARKHNAELAADYLGNCVYEGEADFKASGYYSGMVKTVIEQAKKQEKESS